MQSFYYVGGIYREQIEKVRMDNNIIYSNLVID